MIDSHARFRAEIALDRVNPTKIMLYGILKQITRLSGISTPSTGLTGLYCFTVQFSSGKWITIDIGHGFSNPVISIFRLQCRSQFSAIFWYCLNRIDRQIQRQMMVYSHTHHTTNRSQDQ